MDKNKLWAFFVENFKAMPAWLRNCFMVACAIGVFYFAIIRPMVVYSDEKTKTEQIMSQIDVLHRKIVKIEEIRMANEDMLYNIEEVRGIAEALSELHHDDVSLVLKYIQPKLSANEYRELVDELSENDKTYKESVNEMFEKKSKEHLKNIQNKENEKSDEN